MPTIKGSLNLVTDRPVDSISEVWVRARETRGQGDGLTVGVNDRVPVTDGLVEFTALPGAAVLVLVQTGIPGETLPMLVGDEAQQSLRLVVQAAQVAGAADKRVIEQLSAEVAANAARSEQYRTEAAESAKSASNAKAYVDSEVAKKADTDYVDEQDRKIFQQDVIFEGELDQTSRIFPLRTSVNGKINIQVEWSVTQEYVDADSSSSLSLWTVKLHDKDGNVVTGSEYNDRIDGMFYTGAGAPGHNYYKYSSPGRRGEVVTTSNTITVAPGLFVSEVGIYNWSRPDTPGLVVRKVTISGESQTTEVMGQKVNRVEVYDNQRAISDNTSGEKLLRLNPDGRVWIGTSSVTNAHHATNKGYVDQEVAKKANTSHTHAISDVTDLQAALDSKPTHNTMNSGLNGKANKSHTHSQSDITGLSTALSGKADSTHTHTQGEVTGLTAALNDKAAKSHTHTTSQISGLGTALNGKANKSYVDSRPALFSGLGEPPSSIDGAVVGDFWLDTDTMELHKITGV